MTAERARLFVALELPSAVREALRAWQDTTVSGSSAWRPVASGALHVTLCFLGDQAVGEIEAITQTCAAAVAPLSEALRLRLASPLTLPPRRPRVLAVGVTDTDGSLARLQAGLADALASGGWYEPEHQRFLAHITVARARRGARITTNLSSAGSPPLPFTAETVTLLRSRLGGEGSRYERLAGFPAPATGPGR